MSASGYFTRRNPLVAGFLAVAGAVMAAANPAAMLAAKGIHIGTKDKTKRKGRGINGRNLFRSGSSRVYGANGPAPVARRLRQIESGTLTSSNGLEVRHG